MPTSISPSRPAPLDLTVANAGDPAEATLPVHPWFWFGLGLAAAIVVAGLILWIDTTNDAAPAAAATAATPAAR